MKKNRGLLWWIFIGWWWIPTYYICIWWWLTPLKRLFGVKRKLKEPESLMSDETKAMIRAGNLVKFLNTELLLKDTEACYFAERASLYTTKMQTVGYQGSHSGISIRIMKGVTYRTGSSKGTPIRKEIPESFPGILYVTNTRLIFISPTKNVEKKLSSLTTATVYDDGIQFYFENTNIMFLIREPQLLKTVLDLVVSI